MSPQFKTHLFSVIYLLNWHFYHFITHKKLELQLPHILAINLVFCSNILHPQNIKENIE